MANIYQKFKTHLKEEHGINLPLEDVTNIVQGPFLMLRYHIFNKTMVQIRFMYFGVFKILPGLVIPLFENGFKRVPKDMLLAFARKQTKDVIKYLRKQKRKNKTYPKTQELLQNENILAKRS